MKTVKQLRESLARFPENASCYAYEGEVIGVVVTDPSRQGVLSELGVIICSSDREPETELHVRDASGNVFVVEEAEYTHDTFNPRSEGTTV